MTTETATEWVRTSMRRGATDDEWWAQRAPFVGASTVAALFGEHPFITLAQLARERREGTRRVDSPAMERGRFLEEAIAQWWAAVHGAEITEAPELFMVNGVVIATLDRLIVDQPAALEVKTTNKRVHEVERYWWWQCQAQLACTGFDRIEVAAFDASMLLQSFTVQPDLDAMQRLIDEAGAFIERCKSREPIEDEPHAPAPDAIELGVEARIMVQEMRKHMVALDVVNREIGYFKGRIDQLLGAHNVGLINGREVVRRVYRTTRNALDVARLRDERPDIADYYTKPPTTSTYVQLKP